MKKGLLLAVGVFFFAAVGCGGSDSDKSPADVVETVADMSGNHDAVADSAPEDLAREDLKQDDAAKEDAAGTDLAQKDAAQEDAVIVDFGFDIRAPETHEVTCSSYPPGMPKDPMIQPDMDWLCTFDYGEQTGHVYIQATPVDCLFLMGPSPIFEVPGAWLSIDGQVSNLENPLYDLGGNHQNDWFEFSHNNKRFKYYHSSFGWGWRKCQPMDCIQVLDGASGAVLEDGCTKERTLPVACVPINEDGSYDPPVDTFEPCDGDPNYQ